MIGKPLWHPHRSPDAAFHFCALRRLDGNTHHFVPTRFSHFIGKLGNSAEFVVQTGVKFLGCENQENRPAVANPVVQA